VKRDINVATEATRPRFRTKYTRSWIDLDYLLPLAIVHRSRRIIVPVVASASSVEPALHSTG